MRQPFLNSIFIQLSGAFPLAGVMAYMTFAIYLLFASGPPRPAHQCPQPTPTHAHAHAVRLRARIALVRGTCASRSAAWLSVKGQMIFGMRFFLIAIHPLVYCHALYALVTQWPLPSRTHSADRTSGLRLRLFSSHCR